MPEDYFYQKCVLEGDLDITKNKLYKLEMLLREAKDIVRDTDLQYRSIQWNHWYARVEEVLSPDQNNRNQS